ncbi:hypothetical protein [Bacillus sp. T33-2]|uniref:hypothetical protein n=1 Tax=Bacillus sp. T33-2 TaxID=2054168 RepID=UPI0011575CDB|nr:hypothetical protein [Bacillus sp. T33-2]
MRKKWVLHGVVIVLIVVVIFALDRYKLYKEEKPPVPVVTAGGTAIKPVLGAYKWNGQPEKNVKSDPAELLAEQKRALVDPGSTLEIRFDKTPENITYGWYDPYEKKVFWEEQSYMYHMWENGTFTYPNTADRYTTVIKAEWEEGQVTYYFDAQVENKFSYQGYLSDVKGSFSYVVIEKFSESAGFTIPYEFSRSFHKGQSMEMDADNFNTSHPELPPISGVPAYLIFDHEKLLYQTGDKDELLKWLSDTFDIKLISPQWYSKVPGKLSVLAVLKPEDGSVERLKKEENAGLISTIEVVDKSPYPQDVDMQAPMYYVFDENTNVFIAYDYNSLQMFLNDYATMNPQ